VAAGNFHGRTVTMVSFSHRTPVQDAFGPFTPGFKLFRSGPGSAGSRYRPQHRRGDAGTHPG
jgi:ornithine--oxo-acid transaminase